jgi:flagellar FliJ protein
MKKFVFRLETLLRHRRNIEERERIEFSRIRSKLLAELSHLEMLEAKHAETRSELAQKESGECDSREISWFYRFLDRLNLEMAASRARIAQLGRELEAQKKIMIEASRNKKMIENLRLKKQKEYLVSMERQEQKTIDELVVTRFALKQ